MVRTATFRNRFKSQALSVIAGICDHLPSVRTDSKAIGNETRIIEGLLFRQSWDAEKLCRRVRITLFVLV